MSRETHLQILAACTVAALLQGCGGGGRSDVAPTPQAPRISGLKPISIDQDTTSDAASFRVDDADSAVTALEVSVTTSDPLLVPAKGVVLGGSGKDRTLRVTPAAEATGTATLTITVRDPGGLESTTAVEVRVNPILVAFSSVANTAFGTTTEGVHAKVAGVTVQSDVDDDPGAFDALLQQGEQ